MNEILSQSELEKIIKKLRRIPINKWNYKSGERNQGNSYVLIPVGWERYSTQSGAARIILRKDYKDIKRIGIIGNPGDYEESYSLKISEGDTNLEDFASLKGSSNPYVPSYPILEKFFKYLANKREEQTRRKERAGKSKILKPIKY